MSIKNSFFWNLRIDFFHNAILIRVTNRCLFFQKKKKTNKCLFFPKKKKTNRCLMFQSYLMYNVASRYKNHIF